MLPSRGGGAHLAPSAHHRPLPPYDRRHLIGGRQQGKQSPFSTAVAAMEEVAVTSGGTDLDEDELDKDAMYKRFEELLSSYDFAFKTGDRVTGTIFRVDGRGAYVDIGAKGAAFCPVAEISQCKVDRVRTRGVAGGRRKGGEAGGRASGKQQQRRQWRGCRSIRRAWQDVAAAAAPSHPLTH